MEMSVLGYRTSKYVSGWLIQDGGVQMRPSYDSNEGLLGANISRGIGSGALIPSVIVEVEFTRHKPYFYTAEIPPMLVASTLTLISFWIDAPLLTLALLMASLLTQGIFSWDLLAEAPPSTDGLPKFGKH